MAKSKWYLVKDKIPLVEKWTRDGLTEEQICKNLGISKNAMNKYKNTYNDLMTALKKGREVLIKEVENALIKRALGFEYEEVETYIKEVAGTKTQMVKKIKKHCPPDDGACAFVLKNKDRENWCDNPKLLEIKRELLEMQKKAQEMEKW